MDNLGAHKGEGVRDLIEAQGCEVLFLPPYSCITWLTAKGRSVSSRTHAICLSTLSADSKTEPTPPRPPASETARLRDRRQFRYGRRPDRRLYDGTSTPRRSHIGERNTLSPYLPLPVPPIVSYDLSRFAVHGGSLRFTIVLPRFRSPPWLCSAPQCTAHYLIPTTIESGPTRCST